MLHAKMTPKYSQYVHLINVNASYFFQLSSSLQSNSQVKRGPAILSGGGFCMHLTRVFIFWLVPIRHTHRLSFLPSHYCWPLQALLHSGFCDLCCISKVGYWRKPWSGICFWMPSGQQAWVAGFCLFKATLAEAILKARIAPLRSEDRSVSCSRIEGCHAPG